MNRDERNPEQMLDQVIDGIKNENINTEALDQSRRRTWDRIKHAATESAASTTARIASCSDFRALLPEYLAGTLPDGRRMLVEDHTHECVACRRALHELSQPAPRLPLPMPVHRPTPAWRKYAIAASLLVTAGLAGWRAYDAFAPAPGGRRAVVQAASGNVFRISKGVLNPALAGTDLAETDVLRTGPNAHLVLKLEDGSEVEVGERAELGVSMSRSDTTLRLERGTVIVQAAKRTSGHLYVTSADCRVAVTGTVFAVNRGLKGSRVSVVEGSVQVEHGGKEVSLRPGDQVSTDTSMSSVPIQEEIAWSRNLKEHLALLNAIADLKTKLDKISIPGLRYGSRLIDLMPADTVIFASVPNAGQALSDAHRLFEEQVRLNPALQKWAHVDGKGGQEKIQRTMDAIRRLSDYVGEEIALGAAIRNGSKDEFPVLLAEVQRAGLKEFLQSEITKLSEGKSDAGFQLIEGQTPIAARTKGELIIVLRGNYVIAGAGVQSLEEIARNIDGSGSKAFASSEFGRRLSDKLRRGAGVLIGFDLQRFGGFEPGSTRHDPATKQDFLSLGADRVRYLIAEQKQSGTETQRSAELSFAGARSGVASWLGAPAPIGGLGFVSPDPHVVAAAVLKKPDQLVDDFLAAKSDASRMFEEARKHLGIDIKQDFAALLGGEITFAIDGPLVPVPSWKLAMDVTDPVRLQQTIERIVNAANMAAQLVGRQGYTLTSETVADTGGLFGQSAPVMFHQIRMLDAAAIPEIHYVYSDGYMLIAPSRALLTKAMQTKRSGVTLARSDRFRALLPRDGRTNFSAIVYQNAGQWLGAVANALGSEEQRAAGELAAKVGPVLVCAYGDHDRIEVVNKGSAWDVVLQSVLQPMLNRGTSAAIRSY